ncbi:MAG TPA: TetR/AcrR family transcriptional regulator [Solirubrobacterales bacterium]|nr:TetR/AcrR family transcriptional regulator [Solirubrobacterales bacterium]
MAARGKARKRNGAERRNRGSEVVDAAVAVFNEKGYTGAAIQDVADRVGVLKGSLYHYIDSKEDLLASIFEESDEMSFALMEESRNLQAPAVERLRQFARNWSLWYLENIERTAIYVNEWKHLTGPRLKKVVQMRHEYEKRVTEIIDDVRKDGQAAPGLDVRYACFFVLSAINGLPTWYRRGGPDPPDYIADAYAELIVGLVCQGHDEGKPAAPARPAKAAAKRKAKAKAKAKSGARS